MKSVRNRVIFLVIILALGAYYLYPTLKYNQLAKQEQENLIELSSLSGIPLNRLVTDIYRDDVDLQAEIEAASIAADQKETAKAKLNFMRGEFLQDVKYYRPKAIKLGLDLQGGMYLVLEVDIAKMLDNAAKGKDEAYNRLMERVKAEAARGHDALDALRDAGATERVSLNRYWGENGQSDEAILEELRKGANDAVDRSLEILRNRIDQFGVSEPSISKLGSSRIALELPGVRDPIRARELVGRTALLEFKILIEADRARDILTRLDDAIAARQRGETLPDSAQAAAHDSTRRDTTARAQAAKNDSARLAADTMRHDTGATSTEELLSEAATDTSDTTARNHPFLSLLTGGTNDILISTQNRPLVTRMLTAKENQRHIPGDVQFLWSNKSRVMGENKEEFWTLYLVRRQAEMTGSLLENAQASIGSGYDPEQAGKPVVTIEFTREGGRIFARVTGANVNRRLGIVLDDKIYMAPNIRDKISGGNAIITGLDDMNEANDIAIVLRAGALPAPVNIAEERTIGPSLGEDSIHAGRLSLSISFLAVILFMVWYYRASGFIADLAMIFNVFLLMAALAMFQFTLTMPGIAGIILTIGMAVDANVLIFERIREELRLGKTVRAAIETGFNRALLTIIDSNTTTAIAGVVLLIYGTGTIRGFALTLTVGIVINMFTAIFLTRLVYDAVTTGRQLKTLSV